MPFQKNDHVRLNQDFAGCPAGSEGLVQAVDTARDLITVNIHVDANCADNPDLIVGPSRIFDAQTHCDLSRFRD